MVKLYCTICKVVAVEQMNKSECTGGWREGVLWDARIKLGGSSGTTEMKVPKIYKRRDRSHRKKGMTSELTRLVIT